MTLVTYRILYDFAFQIDNGSVIGVRRSWWEKAGF